jgi:hypothetical protein
MGAISTIDLLAPSTDSPRCFTTGKTRYFSEAEARRAMLREDLETYQCAFCGALHLTRQRRHRPRHEGSRRW